MRKSHPSLLHLPPNRTSDSEGTSHLKAFRGKISLPPDLTGACAPSGVGAECAYVYVTESVIVVLYAILSVYGCERVCMCPNPACVCGSVKQEQRECQNSRRRIWGSNNRDWQRQTEKQHLKHMLTNQKDSDVLKHQTARCTTLISLCL